MVREASDALPSLEAVFAPAKRIVGRRIAEEYLLVPLAGRGAEVDSLLSLNRVGAFIWEQLDGKRNGRDIVAAMLAHFATDEATASLDYREFVAKLESVKALGPSSGAEA